MSRRKNPPRYGTETYWVWYWMRKRCGTKRWYLNVSYCDRWDSFANFLADMGERPEGMTLDRIDGALGYSPENCRWASASLQARNREYKKKTEFPRGVNLHHGSYVARINVNGTRITLGSFDDPEFSGLVYEAARDRVERLGFVKYV